MHPNKEAIRTPECRQSINPRSWRLIDLGSTIYRAVSKPNRRSQWRFETTLPGLLVPKDLEFGNALAPFTSDPDVRDRRVVRSLGVVPTYEDLWEGERPDLGELIQSVPVQLWTRFLSCIATILAREDAGTASRHQIIDQIFRPSQSEKMRRFLQTTHTAFPIAEFPVLLLLEIALARAEVADRPPRRIDPDSLERMSQGIYTVWSHLTSATDGRILGSPAGAAAALNERSYLGSPMRRIMTAFGLWAWDHPELGVDGNLARSRFNEHLTSVFGTSLAEWVAGIGLATIITQNQPLEEVASDPVFINADRNDLTSDGRALLVRCIEKLSTTAEELRANCRQLDREASLLTEPSLLALKRTPCIQTLGNPPAYRAISPVHLAEAAIERPLLERAAPSESRTQARIDYGTVVEAYVHGLFRSVFGDRYQRLDPANGRKRADGVVWLPGGFLVVECKARRASELIRYRARGDAAYFDELLRSGLRKAVDQITDTTDDVLRGKIPSPSSIAPSTAGSLIVFLQDLALSPVSRSVLDRILPSMRMRHDVKVLRPQVISLERVEELDKWRHLDLITELRAKMEDEDVALECLDDYFHQEGRTPQLDRVRRSLRHSFGEIVRPYLTEPLGPT